MSNHRTSTTTIVNESRQIIIHEEKNRRMDKSIDQIDKSILKRNRLYRNAWQFLLGIMVLGIVGFIIFKIKTMNDNHHHGHDH